LPESATSGAVTPDEVTNALVTAIIIHACAEGRTPDEADARIMAAVRAISAAKGA
jgi:hypothetical protein